MGFRRRNKKTARNWPSIMLSPRYGRNRMENHPRIVLTAKWQQWTHQEAFCSVENSAFMVHFMARDDEQNKAGNNFHTMKRERKKFFDPARNAPTHSTQAREKDASAYMKCNLLPIALSPLICFSCSQLYMCCIAPSCAQAKASDATPISCLAKW